MVLHFEFCALSLYSILNTDMKFVITGGHHNSALVVAQDLLSQGHQVVWFGHRYAQQGDRHPSAEYLEVTASQIPFHSLKAGKSSLNSFPKVPLGIIQAYRLLKQEQPQAVISFGSYLGLTTVIAAAFHRLPIYLHEQTVVAGKANRFSTPFARRIFLTWPQSQTYFPARKTQVVGLPLRPAIIQAKQNLKPKPKTLLILGGKQGSHFINQLIFQLLPQLAQEFTLHHQTGTSSVTGDYQQALQLKQSLQLKNYHPYGYLQETELAPLLAQASLVISRSGAHTTYELAYLAKPCLLIPYEYTHKKEQLLNAQLLEATGQATILSQAQLTPDQLYHQIHQKLSQSTPFKPLDLPLSASQEIIKTILADLS